MISEALLLARIRESSSPSDTLFHTLQLYDQLIRISPVIKKNSIFPEPTKSP